MEVQVKKIKCTKSIINQMIVAGVESLNWECIGFVVNCRKDMTRAYILKSDNNEYRVLASGWEQGQTCLYRRVGHGMRRGTSQWPAAVDRFGRIQRIYDEAEQIFI